MISRKNLWFLIRWVILGIAGAVIITIVTFWGKYLKESHSVRMELDNPVVYTAEVEKELADMPGKELEVMLWTEKSSSLVTNPDFSRSINVRTMGIAGCSGVLFPEENALSQGEKGYCLLGEKSAENLFGTTDIVGREVEVGKKTYQIAGVLHGQKELCIYELDPKDAVETSFAAYCYSDKRKKAMIEQQLKNVYGISGTVVSGKRL